MRQILILGLMLVFVGVSAPASAQYPEQEQQEQAYPDAYAQPQTTQTTQVEPVGMQAPPQDSPPPEDPALAAPGSFRLLASFDPGFAGQAVIDIDGVGEVEADLDPTLGMRAQAQIPIGTMLFTGLNFGVDGYIGDGAPRDADRVILIGIGLVFGFHYPISLGAFVIEPTASLALDFAIATADDVTLEDSEFGFGLGFRGGANFWFTPNVGAQVNLGVQTHQLFGSDTGTSFRFGLTQFRMGVGLMLRFGA